MTIIDGFILATWVWQWNPRRSGSPQNHNAGGGRGVRHQDGGEPLPWSDPVVVKEGLVAEQARAGMSSTRWGGSDFTDGVDPFVSYRRLPTTYSDIQRLG